eukprot:8813288-Heterocapsa_arctica.AAC.1
MEVSQTILSVGELHKKGHEVIFGQHSCLRAGEEDVPLIRVGNLTYVEVMVLPENVVDEFCAGQTKYCLLEWACDPRSRLAEWFIRHGHHAVRLGLPNVDLSEN